MSTDFPISARTCTRAAVAACLLAIGCLTVLSACDSTPTNTPPLKKETYNFPTPVGAVSVERDYHNPPTADILTVSADDEVCWVVTFSDDNNMPVGDPLSGSGSDTFQFPTGATKAKVTIVDCTDDPNSSPAGQGLGFTAEVLARGKPGKYLFSQMENPDSALDLLLGVPARRSMIEISAFSANEAANHYAATLAAGPGKSLAAGTKVHEFLELTLGVDDIYVDVSLPGPIERFDVTIDGVVVADLTTRFNVSESALGNGWEGVSTTVPSAAILPGSTVVLSQRAAGGHTVTRTLNF